jgi:hypothetical protein
MMSKLLKKNNINRIAIASFFLLSSCLNVSTMEAAIILENLSDTNYDVCDMSEISCFAFRKTGNKIVGIRYTPHKGDPMCLEGTIDNNKIVSQAFEILYGYSSDPRKDPSLIERLAESPRAKQFGMPKIQIIEVASSVIGEGSREYSALVMYDNAVLDLGNYELWEENISHLYWLGRRLENRDVQQGCQNLMGYSNPR